VISGILWKLRTGALWSDLPERYGRGKSATTFRACTVSTGTASFVDGRGGIWASRSPEENGNFKAALRLGVTATGVINASAVF